MTQQLAEGPRPATFSVHHSSNVGQEIIDYDGSIIAWTTDKWTAEVICRLLNENEELLGRCVEAVPLQLREANEFVARYHRHNLPTVGGKFAIGASVDGKLVGLAIAGRLVARKLDDGQTLEVLRVCTDSTPNANSFLYGRVKRIAQLMGYTKVITYALEEESGASLRAVGAQVVATVRPREWSRPRRQRKSQEVYGKVKCK